MSHQIDDATVTFFRSKGLPAFSSEDDQGLDQGLVVPMRTADASFVVRMHADDETGMGVLSTRLIDVPVRRRNAVAIHLAELNARCWLVVFSMIDGTVRANVWVDVYSDPDPELRMVRSLFRLLRALDREYPGISQLAQTQRRRRSRLEREIDEILDQLPEAEGSNGRND